MKQSKILSTAKRGQVFIVIAIVFVVLISLFVIIPLFNARSNSVPIVSEVFWQTESKNVTVAHLGDDVELHVVFRASKQYAGSIITKIKKDIAYWFDKDYAVKTYSIDLGVNQVTELKMAFSPDEASQGIMRGYFLEIYFSGAGTNWVMADSYPPRLQVVTAGTSSNITF